MTFTREQLDTFAERLLKAGYKRYDSCLSSSEDYAYFKGFERDEENKPSYQIAYRVWDWTKYPQGRDYGVDILIMVSNEGRTDMVVSYPDLSIEDVERIGREFYEFCLRNKLD